MAHLVGLLESILQDLDCCLPKCQNWGELLDKTDTTSTFDWICVRESNAEYLSILSVFDDVFHLGVFLVCKNVKKKKNTTQNTSEKNPCNLDNLHILSNPVYQHSSPGHFHLLSFLFVFPSSFSRHAVRSTRWRFHSFLYKFGFMYLTCVLSFHLWTFLVSNLSQTTWHFVFQDNWIECCFLTV